MVLSVAALAQSPNDKMAPGFSIEAIDKTIDPCVDFYQYACGNWLKSTEVPADQTEWASFTELYERNLVTLRGILEKASTGGPNRSPIEQKIGDYYGACIDEKSADAKGLDPLKPEFERIAAVKNKADLIDVIAHDHMIGANALFAFYSSSDLHNADTVIAYLDQGGLTLPDRDYYIKDDDKHKEMRQHLVDYVTQMFTLAGRTPAEAADAAQTILRIETSLAKAEMDRTLRRDPKNRDHKMKRDEIVAAAPNFSLNRYFTGVNAPKFSELNVSNPEFFKQVNGVIDSEPLDALKTYVQLAPARLHRSLALEAVRRRQFQDAATAHRAVGNPGPLEALCRRDRWRARRSAWPEVCRRDFRRRRQGPHAEDGRRARSLARSGHQGLALDDRRHQEAGQGQAGRHPQQDRLSGGMARLHPARNQARRSDRKLLARQRIRIRRQIAKIGKPLDRKEWGMTPPTVNAYYSGSRNEIVFPGRDPAAAFLRQEHGRRRELSAASAS